MLALDQRFDGAKQGLVEVMRLVEIEEHSLTRAAHGLGKLFDIEPTAEGGDLLGKLFAAELDGLPMRSPKPSVLSG